MLKRQRGSGHIWSSSTRAVGHAETERKIGPRGERGTHAKEIEPGIRVWRDLRERALRPEVRVKEAQDVIRQPDRVGIHRLHLLQHFQARFQRMHRRQHDPDLQRLTSRQRVIQEFRASAISS
jgi:hypothetical protein